MPAPLSRVEKIVAENLEKTSDSDEIGKLLGLTLYNLNNLSINAESGQVMRKSSELL